MVLSCRRRWPTAPGRAVKFRWGSSLGYRSRFACSRVPKGNEQREYSRRSQAELGSDLRERQALLRTRNHYARTLRTHLASREATFANQNLPKVQGLVGSTTD